MNTSYEKIHLCFDEFKSNTKSGTNMLYSICYNMIYGIAFSLIKNKMDAEDVCQNVFIKILSLPIEKLPKNNEASWLYVMKKNESFDLLRKTKPTISIDELFDVSDDSSFEEFAVV